MMGYKFSHPLTPLFDSHVEFDHFFTIFALIFTIFPTYSSLYKPKFDFLVLIYSFGIKQLKNDGLQIFTPIAPTI